MKKSILLILVCLLPISLFAQEKEEKSIELKNGTVLKGYVEQQPDGSYLVETASGDMLFFSPSEVSRIINLKPTPENDEKQNKSSAGGLVYRRKGELCFSATGTPLTQDDFFNFQGWEKYQKAQRLRKTGNKIMLWGSIGCIAAGVIVGGVIMFSYGEYEYYDSYHDVYRNYGYDYSVFGASSAIGGMASVVPIVTGLIIKSSGNAKLNKMAKVYNQNPGYVLNFGPQQHGVGFALNF